MQLGLEILAALRSGRGARAGRRAAAAAEQVAEQVGDPAPPPSEVDVELERLAAAGPKPPGPKPPTPPGPDARRDHAPDLVVLLALLGVAEHVVRGVDLLEALLRRPRCPAFASGWCCLASFL